MSVTTNQNPAGQPLEVEELIRSLDEIPEINPELRSRVLLASSQAAASAKRQRGWMLVASVTAACAACVMGFAVFMMDRGAASSSVADDSGAAARSADQDIESSVSRQLDQKGDVISAGMGIHP